MLKIDEESSKLNLDWGKEGGMYVLFKRLLKEKDVDDQVQSF
jgi:hypothetical protein